MSDVPSPNGVNGGRDPSGRFSKGNRFGKGNPLAAEVFARRRAFLSVVNEATIKSIAREIVAAAKSGDLAAAKLILEWTIGRPAPLSEPHDGEMPRENSEAEPLPQAE